MRDDEYIGLHALHGERPAGLRVQVRGTAEVPTAVEIGEIRFFPFAAEPAEETPASRPRETILPGEWPLFRRDSIHSGRSPLVGDLGQQPPAVAWSYRSGGWNGDVYVSDVDGDGLPVFIFGTADGRLIALHGGEDDNRRMVFSVQLPAALGTPILCDPYGTGR